VNALIIADLPGEPMPGLGASVATGAVSGLVNEAEKETIRLFHRSRVSKGPGAEHVDPPTRATIWPAWYLNFQKLGHHVTLVVE
jgi:hypothetical protein